MNTVIALKKAKSYTEESLKGAGALKGQKGDPGKDGKDAPSIIKVNVDENNILSVKLSDGKELTGGIIKTLQGEKGKDGISIQKGGTKGQVLVKKSDEDYDTEWIDFSDSFSGGNIEDYSTIQGVLDMEVDNDIFTFVQGTL